MSRGPFVTPKLALVMVGLPARGKTYTAQKLSRYLAWLGHRTRIFNLGEYRRAKLGPSAPNEFFNPDNPEGRRVRLELAMAAIDDVCAWFGKEGDVAILDATNSSRERRQFVQARFDSEGIQVLFVEVLCDDSEMIEANIRQTKLASPDYAGIDADEAVRDFRARIAHYERVYEAIGEDEASYIKLVDVGRQVVVNRVDSHLGGRLVSFLMKLHINPRPILLTRHGESEFNIRALIGGDPPLSALGRGYGRALGDYLREEFDGEDSPEIWTSALERTGETASFFSDDTVVLRQLDEIDAGICDGLSYEEIAARMPLEFGARARDKLRYRYPRGESYVDVINRLEPVIVELERQRRPVVVVAHQAVIRALYAYFRELPREACPHQSIPLHTVIKLTPGPYGCAEERIDLIEQARNRAN
ncbi:MAG: histidine phosphatase family protein [Polyangiaceae bacterium]|nr:histidine phosphatase family protein [Polyangiaceae bacterium]